MKLIPRQKIWLTIVVVTNLALWLFPSNVVELIARDHHTLLGRYSRQHFIWIVAAAIISAISLYVDWSTARTYKKRWFQVITVLILVVPSLVVIDMLLHTPQRAHYVRDRFAYHHPPNTEMELTYEDCPEAYRTYPSAPPGYSSVTCKLVTDGRGFRNPQEVDRCDILVLGDSFAEGSRVSTDDAWPVHLARDTNKTVYNLGMSGYDPLHYLESLKDYGLALKPKYVICLLYEGNDFRSARSDRKRKNPSFSKRLKDRMKQSPILQAIDRTLIDVFGPINSTGAVPGVDLLDWLPLAIPNGERAKYYAFAPKQLRDLCESEELFSQTRRWLNSRRLIFEMNQLSEEAGAVFLVVYAPTKAHVTLPLLAERLPASKVRAFTALSYKGELPEADEFLAGLLEQTNGHESVTAKWCNKEGIPFFSTTAALREAALAGTQVYYTYDQHWTPDGHRVVSEAVSNYLTSELFDSERRPRRP